VRLWLFDDYGRGSAVNAATTTVTGTRGSAGRHRPGHVARVHTRISPTVRGRLRGLGTLAATDGTVVGRLLMRLVRYGDRRGL